MTVPPQQQPPPQQPQYPVQQSVPPQPLSYAPPAPQPVGGGPSLRTRFPMGPLPLVLSLIGLVLLCIAFFGPAALFIEEHEKYKEFTEIRFFGGFYGPRAYSSIGGVDLLPQLMVFVLLAITFGTTGIRRSAARLGTIFFAVLSIGMLAAQLAYWNAAVKGTDHYSEGTDTSPSPSDSLSPSDSDDGALTMAFGWGTYLMIIALLLLIAAAATTFDEKPRPEYAGPPPQQMGPGPYGFVPQQPVYGGNPGEIVVSPDPPMYGRQPPHQQ